MRANHLHRIPSLAESHWPYLLAGALLLGLCLRILALVSLSKSVYFDFLLWDERLYHVLAAKLANGTYASTSVYEFPPLPAYLMAAIYRVLKPNILYIRILNIALGVLTCYVIFLISREMGTIRTGLFACLASALYGPFIFYSIVPLKTSMAVLLFGLSIYLLLRVLDKGAPFPAACLGATAGLILNVRPNYIVIVPLLLLAIIYRARSSARILLRNSLLFTGAMSLALSPFVIRNYRVAHRFALTTSQFGFNLYLGNNLANPDPYYRPVAFASSSPFLQGTQFTIEASRRTGRKLSPQEASSYWSRAVMKMAASRPGAFLKKLCQKTLVFFNQFEAGDHYHIGFISGFVRIFKLPFIKLWMILPLGMAGMAVSVFGSRKLLALGLLFSLYGSTLIVFFTNTRYRLPLLTILIPFAVLGAESFYLFCRARQRDKALLYLLAAASFFVVEFLPVRGTNDLTAYYNTHAIILDSKGRKGEAMHFWEISSRMNKAFSSFANLSLAAKFFSNHHPQKAFSYLGKIADTSFAAASKYGLIGDYWLLRGRFRKAALAYRKSLEINCGQLETRWKLIRVLKKISPEEALLEYKRLKYIKSFYKLL